MDHELWNEVCERLQTGGYDSLELWERDWVDIRALIDSTNNGGLISYFYNSGADRLNECRDALARLGAAEVLTIVKRLCLLFPNDVASMKIDERNEAINDWSPTIEIKLDIIESDMKKVLPGLEQNLARFVESRI